LSATARISERSTRCTLARVYARSRAVQQPPQQQAMTAVARRHGYRCSRCGRQDRRAVRARSASWRGQWCRNEQLAAQRLVPGRVAAGSHDFVGHLVLHRRTPRRWVYAEAGRTAPRMPRDPWPSLVCHLLHERLGDPVTLDSLGWTATGPLRYAPADDGLDQSWNPRGQ
jgi:hypothetical protein